MNFWEKITGSDMKKLMKSFEKRVKKLPSDYQAAWGKINAYLWPHSDLTGEEGAKSFRDKWREQLNNNIARKLDK